MNDLGSPEKDTQAVDRLAKCDPVYERFQAPRACKLCGAQGRDRNAENVSHQPDCPWIYALKSRDEYGPGGKFDRTKTPEERAAIAAATPAAPCGDLAAAQQALAGLWPLLSVLKKIIDDAQAEIAPAYERAVGDEPPEAKPTKPD